MCRQVLSCFRMQSSFTSLHTLKTRSIYIKYVIRSSMAYCIHLRFSDILLCKFQPGCSQQIFLARKISEHRFSERNFNLWIASLIFSVLKPQNTLLVKILRPFHFLVIPWFLTFEAIYLFKIQFKFKIKIGIWTGI